MRVPLQQPHLHLGLQIRDRAAERRLCDVEFLGRTTEVQFIGDDLKGAEMAQFHETTVI